MHATSFRRATALFALLGLLFTSAPFEADAETVLGSVPISYLAPDGKERVISIPSANAEAGGSLAVADLDHDGTAEILAAAGIGNEPRVRILHQDGSEVVSFLAYAPEMGIGINLIACDLDGDGASEIITAPQHGGSPHVRAFNHTGSAIDGGGFFAYTEGFKGGVSLACGNIDGSSGNELVTLPGAGGGPHVRVWKWSGKTFTLSKEWFAGDEADRAGLVGTVTDAGKLWLASSKGLPARLVAYDLKKQTSPAEEHSIFAQTGGTGVETLTAQGNTLLIGLTGISKKITFATNTNAWSEEQTSALSPIFGTGDINGDGSPETLVMPGRPLYGGTDEEQSIEVNIAKQRLYAYENGILANTFLVSTAKAPHKTPIGAHHVLAKVDQVHYAGTDLDGTKWDLGWVPYNLRFYPHVYIHYAYWHNNFGHPMSHGCVNVNLVNMKWIYAWTNVGTSVIIHA